MLAVLAATAGAGAAFAAPAAPPPWASAQRGFRVDVVATGFRLPVNIAFVPRPGDDPKDPLLYVTELYGAVKVVLRDGTVRTFASKLLNFVPEGDQRGLTGIAVDPASGDVLVSLVYLDRASTREEKPYYGRIVRLATADGGRRAAGRTTILEIPEPFGVHHLPSALTFGPDGKLYVHMGDGIGPRLRPGPGLLSRQDPAAGPGRLCAGRQPVLRPGGRHHRPGLSSSPTASATRSAAPGGRPTGRTTRWRTGRCEDRFAKVVPGTDYGWHGSTTA